MSTVLSSMNRSRVISQMSDPDMAEQLLWNEIFTKLAKADGKNDKVIDRAFLVKFIWQMDLNERIHFESKLNLPLEKVETLMKEVCMYIRVSLIWKIWNFKILFHSLKDMYPRVS